MRRWISLCILILLIVSGFSLLPGRSSSASLHAPGFTDVAPAMGATAPGYGTGAAWGDYDGDGDLDLYVVNLGPSFGIGEANVLLRNDGSVFTNVTAGAGAGDSGPGVAAVWGDIDNDGDLDLFVSNRPYTNALFLNDGAGHFQDVAAAAGVGDFYGMGEGTAWADDDRDGLLDLYVANYTGGPSPYIQPNRLFRNLDGYHFQDMADQRLVAHRGNGEGIAWADFDNDGDLDLYVANAGGSNVLFQRQDDGTFDDVTVSMHVPGGPGNSFGAAWGDYDNDGWLDLYVAQQGANKLYRNLYGADFADVTDQAGVGGDRLSLGCAWGDYDSDGDLDLHVANADISGYDPNDVLYRNEGGTPATFSDVTALEGVANTLDSRGSAWADYDNDGDLDLYVVNQGSGQDNRLFRNDGTANHWLGVNLIGQVSNRAAIGARLTIISDRSQIREVSGGSGFASQDSLPAEFGLGGWGSPVDVLVRWPNGMQCLVSGATIDRYVTVTEPLPDLFGAAKAVSTPTIAPGEALTYTITVPNGLACATPARISDTLPLSLTWGGYLTATGGTPTWDPAGRRILWSGTVSAGLAVTITYRVTVNAGLAPGLRITNTATVDDGYDPPFATAPVTFTTLCQQLTGVGFDLEPDPPAAGQTVTFTAVATGSLPITYSWELEEGTWKIGQVVTHSYSLPGEYIVTLTATNACGWDVAAHTVAVCEAVHDADFSWVPPTPATGRVVTLTASAGGTAPITFTWDLGDGAAAGGTVVTHSYSLPGGYTVTLTAANACGQAAVTHAIPVCQPVQQLDLAWLPITPTAGQILTFTASASGTVPITFTWDLGDGAAAGGTVVTHSYGLPGDYTVTLTATNACGQAMERRVLRVVTVPAWRIYLPLLLRGG